MAKIRPRGLTTSLTLRNYIKKNIKNNKNINPLRIDISFQMTNFVFFCSRFVFGLGSGRFALAPSSFKTDSVVY